MWGGTEKEIQKKRERYRRYYYENREKLREQRKYYKKRKRKNNVGRYVTDDELAENEEYTAAFCFEIKGSREENNEVLERIEVDLVRIDKGVAGIHRKYKEKGGKE